MAKDQSVDIILVEDDPGHAVLIKKNLRRAGICNPIITMGNGRKAIDYLIGDENRPGSGNDRHYLILLDLNLPVLDGYQVLSRIKQDERTRNIPVIILTTTDSPREITKCYELGCNVYLTKPMQYDKFCESIRQLGLFLSVVKLPGE